MSHFPQVNITDSEITVRFEADTMTLPVLPLPSTLADWLLQGRLDVYGHLLEDPARVDFFQQHLPVLVTRSSVSHFPFNCVNKGVGFLPDEENLDGYIDLYSETIRKTRSMPWRESMAARIEAAGKLHRDREAIDYRCLTSIEIFRRQTFNNLKDYPLASLLFTGALPAYMSFQVNCAVEIVSEPDPRFTFIKLSRRMFEFDAFHIAQPDFDTGYLFWISEVIDKTPHRVARRTGDNEAMGQHPFPPWDEEALSILQSMPDRSRSHLKTEVERYGAERGFGRITAEFFEEARKVLRH
jgi:hypothetical protein